MSDFLNQFFDQSFMPHGHCYFWQPTILWFHVISDFIIFLSYYSIPVAIIYFVFKRKDLPFNWIFWLFGAFILLCGSTHLMDIYTTWTPEYAWEGLLKAITAIVSALTAVVLWPMIPRLLELPSPSQLRASNIKLDAVVSDLDRQVRQKTDELTSRNQELEKMNKIRDYREDRILELKSKVNELSVELGRTPPFNSEGGE